MVLRPDVANSRFEGTLTLNHEDLLQEKQIDIELVAGACFGATKTQVVCLSGPGRFAKKSNNASSLRERTSP